MAEQKKMDEAITSMDVDFAKCTPTWCAMPTCRLFQRQGVHHHPPYGCAIWENIRDILDGMFKETGP